MNYRHSYTLYKRGGYWYYRVWSADGRRVAKSTGRTSKGAARTYCDKLLLAGKLLSESGTFASYARGFFDDGSVYVLSNALKPKSVQMYRRMLDAYIMPHFKAVRLEDITYSRIMAFRLSLQEKGVAARTINIAMTVLKIIISVALRDNIIRRSPFVGYKALRVPQTKDAFTEDELRTALPLIADERTRGFVLLLALTGMRISEGFGVCAGDVVEADGLLYIHLARQLQDGAYVPLKSGECRDIPIIPELLPLVGAEKPTRVTVYRNTRPAFDAASGGSRRLTVHSLRHFFITSAKSCGINAGKVETIAGHSLKGMEAVYTNYKAKDLAEITRWQKPTYDRLTPAE